MFVILLLSRCFCDIFVSFGFFSLFWTLSIVRGGTIERTPSRGVDDKNLNVPAPENFVALNKMRLALANRLRRGKEEIEFTSVRIIILSLFPLFLAFLRGRIRLPKAGFNSLLPFLSLFYGFVKKSREYMTEIMNYRLKDSKSG